LDPGCQGSGTVGSMPYVFALPGSASRSVCNKYRIQMGIRIRNTVPPRIQLFTTIWDKIKAHENAHLKEKNFNI
jgi:hypothetical protein